MVDWVANLLMESARNLFSALQALTVPALFFLCLGYIVKRGEFLREARRALPEVRLSAEIQAFNIVFSSPFLVIYMTAIHGFMSDHGLFVIHPRGWEAVPTVLTLFVAVFVGDFFHYWRHRLDHTKLLWPAHAVHHSDTVVTWATSMRWHPINLLTVGGAGTFAMLVMGFPVYAIMFNAMMRGYYGFFIHTNVPWTYGWFGKYMVSPAMHRWHHSAEEKAFDKNFGEFFCLFDKAFGTYYLPGPCDGPLGVSDDMQPTLRSQIGYAFTPGAYKPLLKSLRSRIAPGKHPET